MKVDEFTFRKVSKDVREFADQVTIILNYGKYSGQTLTTEPTWVARNGEFAFLSSSSQNRLYFYANNQWNWMAGSPSGGGGSPGGSDTQVQINSQGLFYADSGFTYRASSAVGIASSIFFTFNNDSSSTTYLKYNNSNNYLEMYVNRDLRIQI